MVDLGYSGWGERGKSAEPKENEPPKEGEENVLKKTKPSPDHP